jgi:hypothetical protein
VTQYSLSTCAKPVDKTQDAISAALTRMKSMSVMSNDRLDMDFGHDLIDNGTADDYYTPPYIFKALGVEFDMDVCAPFGGVPWLPAKQHLTIIEDGLMTIWEGRVWCNPPFSHIAPWVDKLLDHGNAIALLPTSKAKWFGKAWAGADGVLHLWKEIRFLNSNGVGIGIMGSTMLFAFGQDNVAALKASDLGRVR